jgi:hypothetical protein
MAAKRLGDRGPTEDVFGGFGCVIDETFGVSDRFPEECAHRFASLASALSIKSVLV